MKDYEDEAFDELEKKLQKQVAHGVTDGSLWRKRQEPERSMKVEGPLHVVCQCDKCKAKQEQDNAYIYASNLAKTIWQKHYMKESPKFALLDTTEGVLTQIDNMTCGLVREKPAQQEQGEPVAWRFQTGTFWNREVHWRYVLSLEGTEGLQGLEPLYTTPQQRTWVGLTDKDKNQIAERLGLADVAWLDLMQAIEAKLKEKNG